MSTETKKLTFEAYLASPEMRKRYDIVDGVLIMSPGPTPIHQWVMQRIFLPLTHFVDERGLGVVMFAPLDLVIRREPLRTRQPDILYLSAERSGIRGVADLRGLQVLEVAPDLVVEVLSPSNTRRDIESKLEDYRGLGVLECWLASPEAETIEVLRLSAEGITSVGIFGIDGTVRSEAISDFSLRLRDVFG